MRLPVLASHCSPSSSSWLATKGEGAWCGWSRIAPSRRTLSHQLNTCYFESILFHPRTLETEWNSTKNVPIHNAMQHLKAMISIRNHETKFLHCRDLIHLQFHPIVDNVTSGDSKMKLATQNGLKVLEHHLFCRKGQNNNYFFIDIQLGLDIYWLEIIFILLSTLIDTNTNTLNCLGYESINMVKKRQCMTFHI